MTILNNNFRHGMAGGRYFGATTLSGMNPTVRRGKFNSGAVRRNIFASEGMTDSKASLPNGARPPVSYVMARKNGGMASYQEAIASITSLAALLGGKALEGSTEISVTIADAEGQLISSGEGSATLSITVADLLLTASLNATGQAEISLTVADATLGAEASLTGSATLAVTGSLTPYAIGHMTGAALPYTELSPQSLADAVLGAAANSPIYANIKQVNDVTVNGTGQTGDEWGPA